MSGRPPCALFPTPAPAGAALLSEAEVRKRLVLALVLSVLLHALFALAPSPGQGFWKRGGKASALDVRLAAPSPAPTPPAPARAVPAPAAVPPLPERAPDQAEAPSAPRRSRGLGVLPVPAAQYFTTDRLTKRPVPASEPDLAVSRKTARYVSGRAVFELWINELGGVEAVEIESTNLPENVWARAAASFMRMRFAPGEIDGRPVGVRMRVEVEYRQGVVVR